MLKRNWLFYLLLTCLPLTAISADLPNWVFQPSQDSEQWFYTVGSGKTENDARLNALGDLATRLTVTINATTQSFVSSDTDDSFFENDISQQSETFTFNKVETLKSHQANDLIYILLKVERIAFFEDLTQLVKSQIDKVSINDNDNNEAKVRKLIEWTWVKPQISKKLNLLKTYKIDVTAISDEIDKLQQQSNVFKSTLHSELILANSPDIVTQALEKHLQSFSNIRPAVGQLKLVLTGLNMNEANSDYHFHFSSTGTLSYFYNSKLVFQKTLQSSSFAKTLQDAKSQAIYNLANQVKVL